MIGDDFGITEEMRAEWAAEDAAARRAEWIVRACVWLIVAVGLLVAIWFAL